MTIEAKIILDSVSKQGHRLTTMQLRYPRFIHAEFMTHRVFSRNASSSRAIPIKRMIEDLRRDPAMPVFWGSNKPGMQAGSELDADSIYMARGTWLAGMEDAIQWAEQLMEIGLHKQIANRVLEPWAHINVVVTATEWDNFYMLRRHKDAQPEIHALADAMWEAQQASTPQLLNPGEWHLPYVNMTDADGNPAAATGGEALENAKKISTARCARVSFLTFEGKPSTFEEDLELYEKLVGSQPIHASPAEHQATPDRQIDVMGSPEWLHLEEWGNFTGWRQHRQIIEANIPCQQEAPAA